ncbi:hypothetical protein Patl1_34975 [Pistacia atlantica]|uniref:Uncharacterized protein n=1 Tax=Pistacia atlantica TaxID=434234 RepID=A0ACC0ZP17_9ROSI|nr:hypothetical protein Patl1_34975 [Pistacia atlantica]
MVELEAPSEDDFLISNGKNKS